MDKTSWWRRLWALLVPLRALVAALPSERITETWPGLRRWPQRVSARREQWLARLARGGCAALTHPFWPVAMALLALCFGARVLWQDLGVDDDLLQRGALLSSNLPQALDQLFVFLDPQTNAAKTDLGLLPWWTSESVRVSFWRPLAALTHWLDYQLWPDVAALMYAHSLLWYGGLCALAALLYRRLMGNHAAAGLAALLFAVNVTHYSAFSVLNARNVLQTACFGLAALALHDRWRRDGWRLGRWLATGCLLCSLLSAEAGIATVAYLAAYALCLDRGGWKSRLGSLAPYLAVTLVWRLVYQALGHGSWGSDFYLDPGGEPLRFLGALVERVPVLLFGQWLMPDPGVYALLSVVARRIYWGTAVWFVLLLAVGLLPFLRRERIARFWGLGMVLAAAPLCAVGPATGRHLIFVGLGALGLLAQLGAGLWLERPEWLPTTLTWRVPAWLFSSLLFFLQGILYPILILSVPAILGGSLYVAMMSLGPLAGNRTQEVVIVNAPSPGQLIYIPALRDVRGENQPERLRALAPGYAAVQLTRLDEHTLLVRPDEGFLLPPGRAVAGRRDLLPLLHPAFASQYGDSFFRSQTLPVALGQRFALTGMEVVVTALTKDGRPQEITARFDVALEASSLVWLQWDWRQQKYLPFAPPAPGESVRVPGPF